mgnify:CR=1 FL=1
MAGVKKAIADLQGPVGERGPQGAGGEVAGAPVFPSRQNAIEWEADHPGESALHLGGEYVPPVAPAPPVDPEDLSGWTVRWHDSATLTNKGTGILEISPVGPAQRFAVSRDEHGIITGDVEVRGRVRATIPQGSGTFYAGVAVGISGDESSETGITLYPTGSPAAGWEAYIAEYVNAAARGTNRGAMQVAPVSDEWLWFVVSVVGTTVRGRFWPQGTPEPGAWQVSRTLSQAPSGRVGLAHGGTAVGEGQIVSVTVGGA